MIADIIVGGLIALIFVLCLRKTIRGLKHGGCEGCDGNCGGSCSSCGSQCHSEKK